MSNVHIYVSAICTYICTSDMASSNVSICILHIVMSYKWCVWLCTRHTHMWESCHTYVLRTQPLHIYIYIWRTYVLPDSFIRVTWRMNESCHTEEAMSSICTYICTSDMASSNVSICILHMVMSYKCKVHVLHMHPPVTAHVWMRRIAQSLSLSRVHVRCLSSPPSVWLSWRICISIFQIHAHYILILIGYSHLPPSPPPPPPPSNPSPPRPFSHPPQPLSIVTDRFQSA